MKLKTYITEIHKSTKRNYLERMNDSKVECMKVANKFEADYWDGDRRYGYGGYNYMPGRWKPLAEKLINDYSLDKDSSVLDVGCGKAFLLYEMKKIMPSLNINGFDISKHGINNAPDEIKEQLIIHDAAKKFPYDDKEFDLVLSVNTLHNLKINSLELTLSECQRVGKNGYIVVESYRNEQELFNLECWALTCQSFFSPEEWLWVFKKFGYKGDYEFIYF